MRCGWWVVTALIFQAGLGFAARPKHPARNALQAGKQTYTKLDYIPESLSGDAECQLTQAAFKGRVLQAGEHHKAHHTDECRQACRKQENCTAWFYCQDFHGCIDEQGTKLPENGCQLKWEPRQPWGIPQEGQLLARPSTYASGYVKRRSATQRTFIRQHSAPSTPMILALSMHPDGECRDAQGPAMQQLTLMSRQDYARWHSYELHVVTQGVPGIPKDKTGQYNKIAFLKKLLDETDPAAAEWILYAEPEMVIDDPAFTFPFEFYAGRDLVLVGDPDKMRQGDPKSVDTGTLLIRNSERSKQLLQQLADVADQFQDGSQYDVVALAMLHLVQQENSHWFSHLHFEHEFCLDCDWTRVDLRQSDKTEITKVWGDQNTRWKLFITRFFNCEVCYGKMDLGGLAKCHQSFREHFEFASCRAHRLAAAVDKEGEHGVPLQHLGEMVSVQGFESDRWVQAQPQENEVVQQVTVHDAQSCYETCAGDARCDFWVWCNQATGCDHNHAFDGRYPYQSCTLIHLVKGVSPYQWQRGPQSSTFASGYMRQDHSARSKDAKASAQQLVTLTGIPTAPCSTPWGDHLISLAVQNKQDWARLHGHELHLMAASTDVRIRPGAWQKVALLRQALRNVPRERAEWIVWIDMDVVLGDIGFTFPLTKEAYQGKDLIVWGNYDAVLAGDTYNGLNGGIMLFRNSDWSRDFLDGVAHFGQFPPNMTTEQVLQTALPSYDIGMFEQNAAVYVLMQQPTSMANVFFEHSYCINCWYKDLDSPLIIQPAFVIHYAGCQMCSGLHAEKIGTCAAIYVRTFAEAFSRLVSLAEMQGL